MADVFEDEVEDTVSIQEFLKDVEDQELEADLVLGGDEGKECTYMKGYMKRQAIFSCLTCTPDASAGVCTACCLSCHDGHEMVELWTKRNFRCDCGNSKFGEFFCKLLPSKDIENEKNSYNHNFKGQYCTCGRPYPDPDADEQVEMIQCCICEDWFHEEHLGLEPSDEVPRDDEGEPLYEDFICQACSIVCSFLTLYAQTIWVAPKQPDAENSAEDKDLVEKALSAGESSVVGLKNGSPSLDPLKVECAITNDNSESGLVEKVMLVGESSEVNMQLKKHVQGIDSSSTCVVGVDLITAPPTLNKGKPMFLSKSWRDVLCKCEKCREFYTQKEIGFLLDKEDSIVEYEKMGKQKRDEKLQEQEGVELNFLNKLGHVEKIEFLSGVAEMKNEIHSFLESFDSSKAITPEDVREVFENLAKKRRRMN